MARDGVVEGMTLREGVWIQKEIPLGGGRITLPRKARADRYKKAIS
jgi:hypothetical protein